MLHFCFQKIKKYYKYDENSCLLELMLEEVKNGKPMGAEGVLWLNRYKCVLT